MFAPHTHGFQSEHGAQVCIKRHQCLSIKVIALQLGVVNTHQHY
jgi:hypothetical protein